VNKIKYKKRIIIIAITFIILTTFILAMIYLHTPGIRRKVIIEAGYSNLSLEDLLYWNNSKCHLSTDINQLNLDKAGEEIIYIDFKNNIYETKLIIEDTLAPKVKTKTVDIVINDMNIKAEDFIIKILDSSDVTVSFKELPNFNQVGEQDVSIILEDSFNNITEVISKLNIFDIKNNIIVELGSKYEILENDFLNDISYDIKFIEPTFNSLGKPVGIYDIGLLVDGNKLISNIEIIDSQPPKAKTKDIEVFKGTIVGPEEFVYEVKDMSTFTIEYKNQPDFDYIGEQSVLINITDSEGNCSEFESKLLVKEDIEPPVISGVTNKTVYIGKTVSYRNGISVKDNSKEELELIIDSSNVNLKKEGKYEVIYKAEDSSGNIAEEKAIITVIGLVVTEEDLEKMVEDILDKIMVEGMDKKEQAYAIYKWSKNNIAYTGSSDKADWKNEAYRGMKNRKGDCFTYFSVSKALLTQVGIENIDVQRLGGKTKHYWNLINCGEGWYHFDSTRNKDHRETFMLTDKDLEEYTKSRGRDYYNFDMSLYPRTPLE